MGVTVISIRGKDPISGMPELFLGSTLLTDMLLGSLNQGAAGSLIPAGSLSTSFVITSTESCCLQPPHDQTVLPAASSWPKGTSPTRCPF